MTASNDTVVSFDDVRQRFLNAESELVQLAASIRTIDSARAGLESATADVSTARIALEGVSTQFGDALAGVSRAVGMVGEAVAVLQQSEAGQLVGRFEALTAHVRRLEDVITLSGQAVQAQMQDASTAAQSRIAANQSHIVELLESMTVELTEQQRRIVGRLEAIDAGVSESLRDASLTAARSSDEIQSMLRRSAEEARHALDEAIGRREEHLRNVQRVIESRFESIGKAQADSKQATLVMLRIAVAIALVAVGLSAIGLLR